MIISKITSQNFIYYNLHSEEVVTSNFIEENNSGIYCDRLQISTIQRVVEDIEQQEGIKNIVLDFNNIEAIQSNLGNYIIPLKNNGFAIVLTNILEKLVADMGFFSLSNPNNLQKKQPSNDRQFETTNTNQSVFKKFYLFEANNNFLNENFIPNKIFNKHFKNILKKYIEINEKPHTSSFVYLKSFVNIKKFISHEKSLSILSIYKLALKIKKEWGKEIEKKPILICQSLNSSYIVSILSSLLKLDILILDKIGPINKLYTRLGNSISNERKYIVVSDMVCLGTEVKIVKNLIEFIGGKYLGNVSIIKAETLKKSDISRKDATLSVFSIDKTNNKELNYYITTELEFTNE
ncbi:hypothetical protein P1X15_10035 [Runella sp. MFBS21]|uniref:hypothetical protein n=1 Tax=Runella sp. MFBS21 TaxID=3034018 RepID=UPI0023F62E02|nr:hypothetical protein [Runella sp. MFBS21]MDF7817937.1 hypothetical protein [Runella sp. MFBS21]